MAMGWVCIVVAFVVKLGLKVDCICRSVDAANAETLLVKNGMNKGKMQKQVRNSRIKRAKKKVAYVPQVMKRILCRKYC